MDSAPNDLLTLFAGIFIVYTLVGAWTVRPRRLGRSIFLVVHALVSIGLLSCWVDLGVNAVLFLGCYAAFIGITWPILLIVRVRVPVVKEYRRLVGFHRTILSLYGILLFFIGLSVIYAHFHFVSEHRARIKEFLDSQHTVHKETEGPRVNDR